MNQLIIEINSIKGKSFDVLDFDHDYVASELNILSKLDRDVELCEISLLSKGIIDKVREWITLSLLPKVTHLKKTLEIDILCSDAYRNASKSTLVNARESLFEAFSLIDNMYRQTSLISNMLNTTPLNISVMQGFLSDL